MQEDNAQGPPFPTTSLVFKDSENRRGFWRGQCTNSLVAHSLPDFLFCPWAHGKFSLVPILPYGFLGNLSPCFFPEAQEHWTLEVFFGAVRDTG